MCTLQPPCLFEPAQQSIICPQGEVQGPGFIILWVRLEVLDHICQEVGPLHATPRHLVPQLGEMDMEVVVGRLVVEVDPQLTGWKVVLLQDGLLHHSERGDSCYKKGTFSRCYQVSLRWPCVLTFPFWKMFSSSGRCSDVRSLRLLMFLPCTMAIRYKSSTWSTKILWILSKSWDVKCAECHSLVVPLWRPFKISEGLILCSFGTLGCWTSHNTWTFQRPIKQHTMSCWNKPIQSLYLLVYHYSSSLACFWSHLKSGRRTKPTLGSGSS